MCVYFDDSQLRGLRGEISGGGATGHRKGVRGVGGQVVSPWNHLSMSGERFFSVGYLEYSTLTVSSQNMDTYGVMTKGNFSGRVISRISLGPYEFSKHDNSF